MFQSLPIPNSKNILCNAFAQKFFTDTKYEVDLDAWNCILKKVCRQIQYHAKNTGVLYEIHMPSKIGVGMKPDEIAAIKDLMSSYFEENPIILTYHL